MSSRLLRAKQWGRFICCYSYMISLLLFPFPAAVANAKRRKSRPSPTAQMSTSARHTMRHYFAHLLYTSRYRSPVVAWIAELCVHELVSSGLCTRARYHLPARHPFIPLLSPPFGALHRALTLFQLRRKAGYVKFSPFPPPSRLDLHYH